MYHDTTTQGTCFHGHYLQQKDNCTKKTNYSHPPKTNLKKALQINYIYIYHVTEGCWGKNS